MIVTVTPNPSIDRTLQIDRLQRGKMIRSRSTTSEAAGKGLNVSLALATEGLETSAVIPLAAESATTYLRLLADAVPITAVPTASRTAATSSARATRRRPISRYWSNRTAR